MNNNPMNTLFSLPQRSIHPQKIPQKEFFLGTEKF